MIDIQSADAKEIVHDFIKDAQLDIIGLWQVIKQVRKRSTAEADLQHATLKLV